MCIDGPLSPVAAVKMPDGGYLPKGYKATLSPVFATVASTLASTSLQEPRGQPSAPGVTPKSRPRSQRGQQMDAHPRSTPIETSAVMEPLQSG